MNIDLVNVGELENLLQSLTAGRLEVVDLYTLRGKVENLLNLYRLLEIHYNDLLEIVKGVDKE